MTLYVTSAVLLIVAALVVTAVGLALGKWLARAVIARHVSPCTPDLNDDLKGAAHV